MTSLEPGRHQPDATALDAPAASSLAHRLQDAITGGTITLAVGCAVLAHLVVGELARGRGWASEVADAAKECSFYGGALLVIVVALRRQGVRWSQLRGRAQAVGWSRSFVAVLALVLFSLGTLWGIWRLLMWTSTEAAEQWLEAEASAISSSGLSSLAGTIELLLLVGLAPVVEEILFRGVALRHPPGVARRYGILLSSAVFALFHAPNVLGSFAFALTLSLLALRTRGLLVPIVCHGANNALCVLGITLAGASESDSSTPPSSLDALEWLVLVLLIVSTLWVVRELHSGWQELSTDRPAS